MLFVAYLSPNLTLSNLQLLMLRQYLTESLFLLFTLVIYLQGKEIRCPAR